MDSLITTKMTHSQSRRDNGSEIPCWERQKNRDTKILLSLFILLRICFPPPPSLTSVWTNCHDLCCYSKGALITIKLPGCQTVAGSASRKRQVRMGDMQVRCEKILWQALCFSDYKFNSQASCSQSFRFLFCHQTPNYDSSQNIGVISSK